MQTGSSGNARDESWKAEREHCQELVAKTQLFGWGSLAWLLGLLGGRLAGMRQSYHSVTLYGVGTPVLMDELCAMVWYAIVSLIMPAKCQVPSTLSSALYDLLRINQLPMGHTGSQAKSSYRLTSPSQPGWQQTWPWNGREWLWKMHRRSFFFL